ncbi:hypothetical protein [Nocardia xishanensis]|uniref:Uncharacterized protein n=1 Tax=Nocardia xishanensis TaxID=238964 RepID=A0ABW7XCA6_9NOCA
MGAGIVAASNVDKERRDGALQVLTETKHRCGPTPGQPAAPTPALRAPRRSNGRRELARPTYPAAG